MSLEWLLIRGSGLVAFGLLAMATIWGLLISTKILGRAVKAKGVTWFHESLGIGALLATIIHMVALSVHEYVDFSWPDLLIPGRSTWRPIPTALGVIGFYTLTIVSLSFYAKPLIGQQAWRIIHQMSFGLFVATVMHGIFAGTDSGHPAVVALYASTGTAVLLLLVIRVAQSRQDSAAPTRPARTVERAHRPDPRSARHPDQTPSAKAPSAPPRP